MPNLRLTLIVSVVLLISTSAAAVNATVDPLRFFVGRTEGSGRVNVIFHKGYGTHSIGIGRIESDGSLLLVQQIFDDGKPPYQRRWRVRQAGPGHYIGAMSEAVGPVTIDKVGERYRFRFGMDGHLRVEQWLTPLAGGRLARSSASIRKFGMTVATTEGSLRRV
ncbi:MAG: DUF3833 family protein [Sphingomicrobium sp.]